MEGAEGKVNGVEPTFWDENKKWILIGLGVLILLILACVTFFVIRNRGNREQSLMPTPVSQATPTMTVLPTATPVPAVPGNVWVVSAIDLDFIREGGYKYMVAEFSNKNVPSLKILRRCGAPGAPAPEVGHEYSMNEFGVLVPIEGIESPLQRFYEIK